MWDHKDHKYITVANYTVGAAQKFHAALESSKTGDRLIRERIDKIFSLNKTMERESLEAAQRVRKSMRSIINAVEDRERSLLEQIETYREQRSVVLQDQANGLRAALKGLSKTTCSLKKAAANLQTFSTVLLAKTLTMAQNQMQQYAVMYKSCSPSEAFITVSVPKLEQSITVRDMGDVNIAITPKIDEQPIIVIPRRQNHSRNNNWHQSRSGTPDEIGSFLQHPPGIGQAIMGTGMHIIVSPAAQCSMSFGFDGADDGHVSRPWGLCVDREGNIVVADRRNNRVQVFYPDGSFKLKFGTKGVLNGQFDLPAGIAVDPQNRIVVVDKDNHRVQIFSPIGIFLTKFGTYGKDCGQFQYPWDVAVNSRGDMLVTDSRNHRIQMFSKDGHFISRFSFDGMNHNRSLKGLTTPRGVCFTPKGDIIVSDFENHRLLLIDSCLTKVIGICSCYFEQYYNHFY